MRSLLSRRSRVAYRRGGLQAGCAVGQQRRLPQDLVAVPAPVGERGENPEGRGGTVTWVRVYDRIGNMSEEGWWGLGVSRSRSGPRSVLRLSRAWCAWAARLSVLTPASRSRTGWPSTSTSAGVASPVPVVQYSRHRAVAGGRMRWWLNGSSGGSRRWWSWRWPRWHRGPWHAAGE